jgi:teichoic acid transport system ATP-binding protein
MAATDMQNKPALIAEGIHVTYRVFGGKKTAYRNAQSKLREVVEGSKKTRSAVTEIHAVRGISLVAHHGESIGIVGRNGAGKSTLLRALAGLIPPSKGKVYVDAQPSLLGVSAALMPTMTGEKNIMLGCLALGLTFEQAQEKFDEIVEFSGIGEFVYLPMNAYSSGMQARLRFAISAAIVPDILMVDEALATGDREFRKKSEKKFREIRDQAGTLFLVSHNPGSIEDHCDRAVWIEQGKIIADGDARDVMKEYIKKS